jgi:glycerol-3-phosphate cytidylyltransferase
MNNQYTFVRHGQTYWNKNGIMHGQYDIPLNYTGFIQANKISEELKNQHFDICFSSPLQRAKSTAFQILKYHKNVNLKFDDRLKELNKGLLEGKHLNSEKILSDENSYVLKKFNIESKIDFFKRVKDFIDFTETNFKNKNILIVAHSGTIKMCFFYFDFPKIPIHKAYYLIHIKNCKAYKINDFKLNIKKMKIGFFPMVADILHSGHVIAIEEAKKYCDYLIIGLHCKPNYKNPQQSIYERYMQLRAVKWVDEVIPYENIEKDYDLFKSLSYDVYFLGNDHKGNEWELKNEIESLGREIVYLKRNHKYSSSKIKNDTKENIKK